MKVLISLLLLIQFYPTSAQDEWVKVYSDDELIIYYHKSRAIRTGTKITVWEKSTYPLAALKEEKKILKEDYPSKTDQIENYSHSTRKMLYDCKQFTYKLLSITHYDRYGDAIISKTYNEHLQDWKDLDPDTRGEAILKELCSMVR